MFEFPNDGTGNLTCAGSAAVTFNAGYGRKFTTVRLDYGSSGFARGVDVADVAGVGVLLTGCDTDCETCDVAIDVRCFSGGVAYELPGGSNCP